MIRRTTNTEFLQFHLRLRGYKFYFKNKEIPIFILYWRGYDEDKLIFNQTDIKTKLKR